MTVSGAAPLLWRALRGMRAIGLVSLVVAALLLACDSTPSPPTITPVEVPRFSHQALLLDDGRILVNGGFIGTANNNVIVPFPLDIIDIYDPRTGGWSTIPLEDQRSLLNRTLKLPDGTVLFVGVGSGSNEQAMGAAYGLNTTDHSWKEFAAPPTARAFHRIVLMKDGRVMVAGGIDFNAETSSFFSESTNTVDIFDPVANTWQQAAPMIAVSEEMWLFSLNDGRVLALAGESEDSGDSPVHAQTYDPDSDTWTIVDSYDPYYLPTEAVQLSDGRVLVTGRLNESEATVTARSLPERRPTQVTLKDGRKYYRDRLREVFPDAKVYDPATDTWTATLGDIGRQTPGSLTLLGDGRVLLAGGEDYEKDDSTGGYQFTPLFSSTTAVYDPDSNFWSPGPNLAERRSEHSATLMPGGWVVLLGGVGLTKVGEDRGEAVPLNTMELIDSMAIPQIDPAAVATMGAGDDLCDTTPIPPPSTDIAPADGSLSPRDIIGAARAAMNALDSYHTELRFAVVDGETDSGWAQCVRGESNFQAPDRVREDNTIYGATFGEISTETIIVGASAYRTDSVTEKWERVSAPSLDSPYLFGDDATTGLRDASIEGIEELNNVDVYRVGGTVSSDALYDMIFPYYLPSNEFDYPLRTVFWVGVEDSLVRKVSAEGVVYEDSLPRNLFITIEYSAFDEEIVIEAPEVGTAS